MSALPSAASSLQEQAYQIAHPVAGWMGFAVTHYETLIVIFGFLMGLSVLLYVILDGYDLGVGMLLPFATPAEKDSMIASIGPFWDANETWLVMGIGILLIAFPVAHGIILTALYLPTAVLLVALILRGVSFDFRAKVLAAHKKRWDLLFFTGSLGAALAQGFMLGLYIMGFNWSLYTEAFALLTAVSVAAGYVFIGASWLIMKTTGELQKKAVKWAQHALWVTALGIALVSMATPLVSPRIFAKWFSLPDFILLLPIPLITGITILGMHYLLKRLPMPEDALAWAPFSGAILIFVLCFQGLAYSFYPYVVPDSLTLFAAAASPQSLAVIFIGAAIVLPCIIGYTCFAYRIFWGKVQDLKYY